MEIHHLSAINEEAKAYTEFLRTHFLSLGIYRLPAGGTDNQQPHTEEEIYFVVSGRAQFSGGTSTVPVKAGDILFVPANEAHRFHDIIESLELLVFFAPAEGTNLGAKLQK